jgi:7-keto-8-aminopelargonate synthetase-like enzyme
VGTITALLGKDDIIIVDKLVHACIVDAAKLSGAKLRVFAHNDLNELENILKWAAEKARSQKPEARTLVVTESVFSMDGDTAPLKEIGALKEKYGAWLMVDEAHATGLYGANRRGLAEALGVSDHIEIQMGTLGKALGASGGYICGSRALIDFLVNRARSFIFSTAPVPAAAAAAAAGIKIVRSKKGEELNDAAWNLANLLDHATDAAGVGICTPDSLIMPLIIGDETRTVAIATDLREKGFFVPAIRYPTVARNAARLRITITAAHSNNNVGALVTALSEIVNRKS